jgi:outer membrane protein assembly factor BamB
VQINLKVDKDNVILVFSKGRLHALSSIDGEVLWEKDFSAERFKQLNFDVS